MMGAPALSAAGFANIWGIVAQKRAAAGDSEGSAQAKRNAQAARAAAKCRPADK